MTLKAVEIVVGNARKKPIRISAPFKLYIAPPVGAPCLGATVVRVEAYNSGAVLHWLHRDGRTSKSTLWADGPDGPIYRTPVHFEINDPPEPAGHQF